MRGRRYFLYDVFTDRRLAGNPLAIVADARGLTSEQMQAIAAEFNLSETAFVLPAREPAHRAQLRIFTPDFEMPFAGHPTVGTAIALAENQENGAGDAAIFVLEEKIGPVRCAVTRESGLYFAEFDLPRLPEPVPMEAEPSMIAAALGLGPHEVGFENHRVNAWSAGVPYVTVPVTDLETIGRLRFDTAAWMELAPARPQEETVASAYVYCRETTGHDSAFHARMFVPSSPSYEDPATGSAAAAFAGAILHFDQPVDGSHRFWIEQGMEMGRPSRLRLEIDVVDRRIASARIGGHAVKTAEGTLFA